MIIISDKYIKISTYTSNLILTLTLPGPSAGVGGSLTVTVA